LGYRIRRLGQGVPIYVGVRDVSQARLIDSICGLVTSYKATKDQKHLDRLDRRISGVIWKNKRYGWLFYFSELNDLSILRRFDSIPVIKCLPKYMLDFQKPFNDFFKGSVGIG
jgi:RNA-directed DNA polymerase